LELYVTADSFMPEIYEKALSLVRGVGKFAISSMATNRIGYGLRRLFNHLEGPGSGLVLSGIPDDEKFRAPFVYGFLFSIDKLFKLADRYMGSSDLPRIQKYLPYIPYIITFFLCAIWEYQQYIPPHARSTIELAKIIKTLIPGIDFAPIPLGTVKDLTMDAAVLFFYAMFQYFNSEDIIRRDIRKTNLSLKG